MNVIDKLISGVSPTWALSRAKARHMLGAYEAVKPTHQRNPRRDQRSADGSNCHAIEPLREQARFLENNYDIARGILNCAANNVIGSHIGAEPKVKTKKRQDAEKENERILELWEDWCRHPETTGEYDMDALCQMAFKSMFRDGECFAKHLMGNVSGLRHNSIVQYSLEMLEAEYCPVDLEDENKRLIQGIQRNKWGQPTAFYFHDKHPRDGFRFSETAKATNAEIVSHIKAVTRFRQSRGVSQFAPIFTRLYDVKDYEESERIAARLSAAMSIAFVNTNEQTHDWESSGERYYEGFQPGMVYDDLEPGVKPEVIESKRPSSLAMPFRDGMLRATASGAGVSYSTIAKDYSGTFSSQRQELVESYQSYKVMRSRFISMFVRPTYERFVDMCLLQGLIKPSRNVNPETLKDVHFEGSQMPWIDPKKEADANISLVQAKLKTRTQVLREMGLNPQQVEQQLKKEAENELFQTEKPEQPKQEAEPKEEDDE
jgi:lambda family phage portal protein